MSSSNHLALQEKKESLWRLIVSPIIWSAHFMASYLTAAIWCAKFAGRDGPLAFVRWAIVIYTIVALIGIAWNGWDGYRRHRHRGEPPPHDDDTPEDRHRFLGLSTALLAALSAVATVYAAFVVFFFRSCG